jgi:hypothetical protein
MLTLSNKEQSSKGIVFTAYNNDRVDYQLLVDANARRIKQLTNINITVITDSSWSSQYVDQFVVAPAGSATRRTDQILVTDHWYNQNRNQVYNLSPYDKTLLLDADYFLNSTNLFKVFDLDYEFLIAHKFYDLILTSQREATRFSEYGLDTVYATAVFFQKTPLTKTIFTHVEQIKDNWDYYQTVYQFVSKFRNDHAFAMAMHEVNHGHADTTMLLDHVIWNAMPNTDFCLINGRPYIRDLDNESTTVIDISSIDVHILNKESAQRYAQWILDEQ